MGLSTVIRLLVIAGAILFASSADAQLLTGVTRWRPGTGGGGGPAQPAPSALLHFDGTNGSTTIIDSSGNNHVFVVNGDTALSTAQAKFGTASVYFDGTAATNLTNTEASLNFGSGDFTVDFWIMWNGTSGQNNFYYWDTSAVAIIYRPDTNSPIDLYGSALGGALISGTTVPTLNVWHHVALTRQAGSVRLFLDGKQEGSTYTSTYNFTAANIKIGSDGNALKGWIDEFRIVVGTAAWTANFTPPTSAYSSTGGPSLPVFLPHPYQGAGDAVPGSTAWYGLRAYSNAYAVANGKLIRLHRLSDDAQCDVTAATIGGFGNTANCDAGGNNGETANAFCNSTTCDVMTFYDQTNGNNCSGSCDITQTIASAQPALTFNCIGTLPCVTMVGVQIFNSAGNLSLPPPFSVLVTASYNGTAMAETIDASGNEVQVGFGAFSPDDIYATAGSLSHITGNTQNTFQIIQYIVNDPNSYLTISATANAVTAGSNTFATKINLGAMTGQFVQGGIWPHALTTAEQNSLYNNTRNYWGW